MRLLEAFLLLATVLLGMAVVQGGEPSVAIQNRTGDVSSPPPDSPSPPPYSPSPSPGPEPKPKPPPGKPDKPEKPIPEPKPLLPEEPLDPAPAPPLSPMPGPRPIKKPCEVHTYDMKGTYPNQCSGGSTYNMETPGFCVGCDKDYDLIAHDGYKCSKCPEGNVLIAVEKERTLACAECPKGYEWFQDPRGNFRQCVQECKPGTEAKIIQYKDDMPNAEGIYKINYKHVCMYVCKPGEAPSGSGGAICVRDGIVKPKPCGCCDEGKPSIQKPYLVKPGEPGYEPYPVDQKGDKPHEEGDKKCCGVCPEGEVERACSCIIPGYRYYRDYYIRGKVDPILTDPHLKEVIKSPAQCPTSYSLHQPEEPAPRHGDVHFCFPDCPQGTSSQYITGDTKVCQTKCD